MKMEVLSVQSQYQGQFGVLGSSKVKDWTSPLTPPPPSSSATNATASGRSQQLLHSNVSNGSEQFDELTNTNSNNGDDCVSNDEMDVVDGRVFPVEFPISQAQRQSHKKQPQQQQQQQHFYHQNQHVHQHYYHHEMKKDLTLDETVAAIPEEHAATADGGKGNYAAAYNNNLFYCDPSPADDVVTSPSSMAEVHFGVAATADCDEIDEAMVTELSQRLQAELRAAKSRHLACTEVSLPWDLTPRIAADIIKTSEREPCGVRGCSIFIEFEDRPNNTRRIASFKVDPDTVSTFELFLTLKHDRSGWTSLIPQFLKNLTRSSTILISPDFTLTKNKLYSCE